MHHTAMTKCHSRSFHSPALVLLVSLLALQGCSSNAPVSTGTEDVKFSDNKELDYTPANTSYRIGPSDLITIVNVHATA